MESARNALLDQASADRLRAERYRRLAETSLSRLSRAALEKCAGELEDRAVRLEDWAAEFDLRQPARTEAEADG